MSGIRLARRIVKFATKRLGIYGPAKALELLVRTAAFQVTWGWRPYVSFYRHRVNKREMRSPWWAVGSTSRDSWHQMGNLIFEYLLSSGLRREDTVLDIGCGNLRIGLSLIDYLEVGNYYGIDISDKNLETGRAFLAERELEAKKPHLFVNDDLRFEELAGQAFGVVLAHSVFTHTPEKTVEECMAHLHKVLKPSGIFFATFLEGQRRTYHKATTTFVYPRDFFQGLCEKYGYSMNIDDGLVHPHGQKMMVIRLA